MYLTLHGFFRFAVFSMTDTKLIPQDFYKLPVAKIQNQCFCKLVYVHINKLTGSFGDCLIENKRLSNVRYLHFDR